MDLDSVIRSPEVSEIIGAAYCLGDAEARNIVFFNEREELVEFLAEQMMEYKSLDEKPDGENFIDYAVKNAHKYHPFYPLSLTK